MGSFSTLASSKFNEGRRRWLTAIKVVLGLVFLGWLMMWIVIPTKPYSSKWNPKIQTATDSTFLGREGTRILIFTFPILFIAVVGCVYLHLVQKSNGQLSSSTTLRFKAWKRPVLQKGPLGVLSAIELAFCIQFLALVIWVFAMFLSNNLPKITSSSAENEGEKLWEAKLSFVGVILGVVSNMCCAFLFFPVTRTSSLLLLIGLTSESSIKYHMWLGHLVMTLFSAHGLCFIITWASSGQISEMLKWDSIGVANLAGEIALLAGLVMWATTYTRIRRKMFELFFYSHQLYFVFLIFYLFHVGVSYFCYILPGVYLFLVDRYLRFLQSRRRVRLVSARLLPSEAVELNFAKTPGLTYAPTSMVFVNVPSISWMQWHPFTVSSSSSLEAEVLSVVIKKEGSWTQKLYQTLSQPSLQRLQVSLEGPYGPVVSLDFLSYDSLILISGGSGITPFISIVRDLIHKNTILHSSTPTILLLCSFKTSSDLSLLDFLLPSSSSFTTFPDLINLRIEAFITREQSPPSNPHQSTPIHSLYFKPNPSDRALSPLLGPNAWLCLAAIISSSFVAFLVIISILTRYYIYPIDHNTNEIYSYAKKSILNLLFLCFCIAVAGSGGMLWNRRNMAEETKQGKVMSVLSPMTSPTLWMNGGVSEEIESGPSELLSQVAKFHFGARPDLRKILLAKDERSSKGQIGVMASGPRGLLREVAEICSSDHKLHYQSISFIW